MTHRKTISPLINNAGQKLISTFCKTALEQDRSAKTTLPDSSRLNHPRPPTTKTKNSPPLRTPSTPRAPTLRAGLLGRPRRRTGPPELHRNQPAAHCTRQTRGGQPPNTSVVWAARRSDRGGRDPRCLDCYCRRSGPCAGSRPPPAPQRRRRQLAAAVGRFPRRSGWDFGDGRGEFRKRVEGP